MEKSLISLCLLSGLSIGNCFAQVPAKPNILLIVADDCSYYVSAASELSTTKLPT